MFVKSSSQSLPKRAIGFCTARSPGGAKQITILFRDD
jgi:hypothetical protein